MLLALWFRLLLLCVYSRHELRHEPYKDDHRQKFLHNRLLTNALFPQLRRDLNMNPV